MHHVAEALLALGGAFLVCGLVARAGVPIGLPTIPLFMLAGVLLGPHTPGFVLVGEPGDLDLVARLGLVFLLFYLGLEFSLAQLLSGGRRLAAAAGVYLSLNIGGGLALGFALGWGTSEAFVLAGIVGISSSAIVTKLLVETRRLGNPETRVILGIIVIEDLFLAFYLALLQPVLGGASGVLEAVLGMGVAFAFLLVLSVVARHGTRWVSALMRTRDEEIVVVLALGLAITTAGAGEHLGVSDAIGAFMIGLILASTPTARRLRQLTHPLRDGFGAIFFFHFGLTIDVGDVLAVLPQILVAAGTTVVLAVVAGIVAARLHGLGRTGAANIGLTVLTRGEFSLVLASLALAAGLDSRLGSFAAGYVLVLAVLGPIAVYSSPRLARGIPRRLLPGVSEPAGRSNGVPLDMDIGTSSLHELGTDLLQVRVLPGSRLHGVYMNELRLPEGRPRACSRAMEPPLRSLPTPGCAPATSCWSSPSPPSVTTPNAASSPSTAAAGWPTGWGTQGHERRPGPRRARADPSLRHPPVGDGLRRRPPGPSVRGTRLCQRGGMAAVTRSPLLSWTTVLPVVALVVLAATWGRELAPVFAVVVALVLAGAVLSAVHHAEVVAHRVGEPFGSLVLAVAVTVIEVALIVTLMVSGGPETASLARDTVFAAVMITCNGIVGLSLFLGARRYGFSVFNAEGSGAALATVATVATLSLVLPTFTTSRPGPEFSPSQLAFAAVASLVLYAAFVLTQTVRHRDFFLPVSVAGTVDSSEEHAQPPTARAAVTSVLLLLVALVAVVGLAKVESPAIEAGVAAVGFPPSFVGVVIALLVLLPETLAAARAALRNRIQISLNLAFGSALASIGLTIPAIAIASIWLQGPLLLGLGPTQMVLLALTVVVGALTVVPGRATRLQGVVHLVLLAGFLFLAVNP